MNQRGGSRTDTLIKLVLIFFVSLLSFSVGTYVGKQVSDSDHRRVQLEGADPGTMTAQTEAAQEVTKGERLSEEEIASLTEEFVKSDKEIEAAQAQNADAQRAVASAGNESPDPSGYKKYDAHQRPAPAEPEVVPAPAHAPAQMPPTANPQPAPTAAPAPAAKPAPKVAAEPAPAAMKVAEGKAPLPAPKEERKPLSVLPSVAGSAVGKFTIQVASYATEGEAKNHAADLTGKGWNAFYVPADVQGRTWYRVSVGLFSTAKSAGEFRQEFLRESGVANAIVQKIVK